MARSVAFVPTAVANTVATIRLEDIPKDVRDEVEEIYKALKENPNGRMRATFDTKEELAAYVTQVTSYCALRTVQDKDATGKPVTVAMPLRFRKSPTKGLSDLQMDYRITDPKTENEKTTEEIREATAAANVTPAKTTPAKATTAKK